MKKIAFLALLWFLFAPGAIQTVKASHYMGGEITWECMSGPGYTPAQQGRYRFHLKLYRECYSTSPGSSAATFGTTETLSTTVPGLASISMAIKAGWPKDLSPQCYSTALNIKCVGGTAPFNVANSGAVQEYYYTSDGAYPNGVQLTGIPPATGWMFYNESCCRNPATNITNASSLGYRLRAIMYPYANPTPQNTYPCFDNSPQFAEVPRTVICSGYPFKYNHNAFDKELDSLVYSWGQPLNSGGAAITGYSAGYSYLNPLPGPAQNPNNVGGAINPQSGEITFTSFTNGAFVTSTKVTAYKCGIKVAEIWRDMQVVLLPCGTNSQPTVTAPFPAPNLYSTTVYAGDLVTFSMSATDFQFNPNMAPQNVSFTASGAQFGAFVPPSPPFQATFSPTVGCLNPPCATLTPAPGPNYPLSAQFAVSTLFSWQTGCQHLATNVGCGSTSNIYTFVIKAMDDYCPAPAIKISTITVIVLPKPTLPSPPIQCVKVLPNGNVQLSWSANIDTMHTFQKYFIYSSPNLAGPYTKVDSISNINQTTYTHTTANASLNPLYYFIRTKAGCPGLAMESIPKDTVSTIDITVQNLANGGATLSWNPIRPTHLPSSSGIYNVWREYPAGNWVNVGNTVTTFFFDTATVCGDSLFYRIEIADTNLLDTALNKSTCYSVSNIKGDFFQDATAPPTPVIDSVSIDPLTQKSTISWNVNSALDTRYYIIYAFLNGGWTAIDSVLGVNNHTYTDLINDPCGTGYMSYCVAAKDSCNNLSPMSDPQNTIFVKLDKAICDDQITVSWNSYNNMVNGLAGYEIWVEEENNPATLLVPLTPNDTTYIHLGLTDGHKYCYTIKALGIDGRTSSSCHICEVADKPNQPQFSYIRSASVLETNNAVELTIHSDTSAKVTHYRIERNEPTGWTAIGTVPPAPIPTLTYIDNSAAVRQKSYTYRVIVVDSCGDDAMTSNLAKSILLNVKADKDLKNILTWSPYSTWLGTVDKYEIYRKVDGVLDPIPVAIIPAPASTYTDDVVSLDTSNGIFDYYIIAIEGAGNTYGFTDMARSNEVRVFQKPRMYIPTAFYPGSTEPKNQTFLPKGVFANSKDYELIIFNRWGKIVWTTKEYTQGWDGKIGNVDAEQGVYTYQLKFTTSDGKAYERSGTVTLIR